MDKRIRGRILVKRKDAGRIKVMGVRVWKKGRKDG